MTCQEARELFSGAVDDAVDAVDRKRLEAHVAGCADCRREWARFEQTVSLLRGAEPIRAPAGFVENPDEPGSSERKHIFLRGSDNKLYERSDTGWEDRGRPGDPNLRDSPAVDV